MVLARLIKGILSSDGGQSPSETGRPGTEEPAVPEGPRVLNVGGGSKQIAIPEHYQGWQHLLLDIAPGADVDVVQDARELSRLSPAQFDAVYCSHNLEHYFRHDALKVLQGFLHVLKADGFAEIRVPDMRAVIQHMARTGMDLDDALYQSPAGPITAHDVWYGYGRQIEASGVDFYAHKCGFTAQSLTQILGRAGFAHTFVVESPQHFEIRALAFKQPPEAGQKALLGLP